MKLNRKGQGISYIVPIVITFVIIVVVGSVGLLIWEEVFQQANTTGSWDDNGNANSTQGTVYSQYFFNKSSTYTALNGGKESIMTIMQWLPLIGLVMAAVIIIGLILGNLSKQ